MKKPLPAPRLALAAALLLFPLARAQRAPAPTAPADEVVELSPFVISSSALIDGNRIAEATAGTLVARPIDKLPMGIQVVSAEMMKELNIFNADGLGQIVPGLANQNQTTSEGTGNNTQYASRGFTVLPRRNGFAPGAADAALLVKLRPGSYTFQVAPKGSAAGTVLGEAYELP